MSRPAAAVVDDNAARFARTLDRLVEMSKRDYYNPYRLFDWDADLPDDRYWMSPELMSVHGTAVEDELTQAQRWALSKWESVNFYSLNVHGIRELLTEMVARVHTRRFERESEYFHLVIGEENEHMWFFATFCRRYAGKVYPNTMLKLADLEEARLHPDVEHFLVFAKLVLFEIIVDHYNATMAADERLHPVVRKLNDVHHRDESRHIAFGRQLSALLHEHLRSQVGDDVVERLDGYLRSYVRMLVASFCNPRAFADAGIPEPYRVRERVLADPAWARHEERVVRKTTGFLARTTEPSGTTPRTEGPA